MSHGGIQVRECKYDTLYWHGFTVKQGMLFGEHNGTLFVWTGGVRPEKRPDGTVSGKEVKIFTSIKKRSDDPDQRPNPWGEKWISCGNGMGKKILAKSLLRQYKIVPPPKFKGKGGRALFTSDKSRRNIAAEKAYYWDCQ